MLNNLSPTLFSNINIIYKSIIKSNYKGGLKSSYDDVIFAVDDFLTRLIQALQHQWKKCVGATKETVFKNKIYSVTFNECFGQLMNFSADPDKLVTKFLHYNKLNFTIIFAFKTLIIAISR